MLTKNQFLYVVPGCRQILQLLEVNRVTNEMFLDYGIDMHAFFDQQPVCR